MATWRDEFELLCERCGYSIEGLPQETNCPECGRPVVESLPEARSGTAWQQDPSARSWARTLLALLCHPRRTVRTFKIERESSRSFAGLTMTVAAALPSAVCSGAIGLGWVFRNEPVFWTAGSRTALPRIDPVAVGSFYILAWVGLATLLWVLTRVEYLGIRTFGRFHRTRITRAVARTITAHATAGWMGAAILASVGFLLGVAMLHRALRHDVGPWRGPMMLSVGLLPALGGFLGMLWFESIVYLGVLNCKFANRERAGSA